MSGPATVVLVGIGGYGNNYVSELLDASDQSRFSIVAAVDPAPESCRRLAELIDRKIPVHRGLEDFYATGRADLAILSTPPFLHADQTCLALGHGSHVLCEKPLCVTPDEVRRMSAAQIASGKSVAVGYQWSFSPAIDRLKSDIAAGIFGAPRRFKTLVLWPRGDDYYQRNRWAGRRRTDGGQWVLDSPASNAAAHFLHNMFFVLGSDGPQQLVAELYRARKIENYDTCAARWLTANGVEMLFVASHAVRDRVGPNFVFEFDRATVTFADAPDAQIVATFSDGRTTNYGSPFDQRMRKLWCTLENPTHSICGIADAAAHVRCIWMMQQSVAGPVDFSARHLDSELSNCFEQWKLPSEIGLGWARAGRRVSA